MKSPAASVVIPTRNRAKLLDRVLSAYATQSIPKEDFEVVVVDDASTDETGSIVETYRHKLRSTYVKLDEHRHIAACRNVGIRASEGSIVIQTDADFIPCQGFVAAHIQAHLEWPKPMCTGPAVNITSLDQVGTEYRRGRDLCTHPFPGFNSSVGRSVFEEVGLYDEGFTEYGWEDLEMGLRLRLAGCTPFRVKDALGWHVRPSSRTADLGAIREREKERARMAVRFARKWPRTEVRMSTWVSPAFLALDRVVFAGSWINRPRTAAWIQRKLASGSAIGSTLAQLYANHEYVEGIREALREG